MKHGLRTLLVLAFVLVMGAPVRADGPAVTMQATAGFDGAVKAGRWAPVEVTIKNDGAEFTGTIRFEVEAGLPGGIPVKHTGIYETPVTVPAGATKRIEIGVPVDEIGIPELQLVSGGSTVATVPLKLDPTADVVVGVLGVEPADLPGLAGKTVAGRTLRLVRLDAERLPVDPVLLENLDAILLDRFAYGELAEPKRQSLQAWVEHGGTLIAAAGPEAKRLEGLAPWVPLPVSGLVAATVPGGGQTLALRYGRGMGAVHVLTFDPALEPFASWPGLADLLAPMLPSDDAAAGVPGQGGAPVLMKSNMALVDTLNQFPVREIPSVRGFLIVLGAYALLIGPVHFLLLRGFKRLGWALLTLPVLAAAGSAGAWAYTEKARGESLMVNAVAVLEGQPDSSSLRVHELAGFFAPPASAHTVTVGDALLSPVASMGMVNRGPNGLPPSQETEFQGARQAGFDKLVTWGMHALGAEAVVPVSGTVSGALLLDTIQLKGRLTSHLPFGLQNALVVSATSFSKLGDLSPGDTVDVSVMLPAFSQQFGGDNALAQALGMANQFNGGPVLTADDYEHLRRQQMAWAGAQAVSWARSANQPRAVLVGWTDYQALPITVDGRPSRTGATALYVQPLPVGLGADEFTIPPSLLPGRLVSYSATGQSGRLQPGWNIAKGESAIVDFTIPADAQGRVAGVEVRVPFMGGLPNGKYPLAFSFYRWSDGTWVPAESDNSDHASPGPDPAFVSPAGVVRVKLTQVIPERVPLGTPGLAVQGRGVKP